MYTHRPYKITCPKCDTEVSEGLVKLTAKQKITNYECVYGHKFAYEIGGDFIKLAGVIEHT